LLWVGIRLLVTLLVVATAYGRGVDSDMRQTNATDWLTYRMAHWDSLLYGALAVRGYPAPGETCCYQAFFPGFPWLMRTLAPLTANNVFLAGFLVTQLAGLVSAALLWRLAVDLSGQRRDGLLAVLFMSVTPMSIFFTVVYTESLFLALSLGAWLCGLRADGARPESWRAWHARSASTAYSSLRPSGRCTFCESATAHGGDCAPAMWRSGSARPSSPGG